jgi:hypothetical protein
MRTISAADSVSFAVQRTRDFLFRPFRWGTYLKLGLVALITEGIGSNSHVNQNHGASHGAQVYPQGPVINSLHDIRPEWIVVIAAVLLLVILISFVIFYLVTRLRFAFFNCLVQNTTRIAPGWRLYQSQATRFFWLNVVIGIFSFLLIVLIAIPFAAGFWRVFHAIPPGGQPNWGMLIALILPIIPIILLLALAAFVADILLRDFMLPHFALDNATSGEAFARAWASIKAEKRQFIVYALFRVILPIIAALGVFFVLLIPGLFLAGAIGVIEYSLHSLFSGSSGAAFVVGVFFQVFFGLVAFGFAILAGVCLGGPLSTGIREYALVFYGGRYPALGNLLYPPPPAAVVGAPAD